MKAKAEENESDISQYANIGDYLNWEFLHKYSLNQRVLARLIKVHNNRINEVIRHKRGITIDTDLRLCRFFGLEEGHFFNLQTELEYKESKEKLGSVLPSIPKRDELFVKEEK